MNESLYHNKISYMIKKEKDHTFLIIICFLFVCLLWVSCLIKVRFSYPINALYQEEQSTLEIIWPYEKIDEITKMDKWKIDQKEYSFEIMNISEIEADETNQMNYQIITLKCEEKLIQNQIVQIKLLDKKEKIIEKIQKIIKEVLWKN